MSALGKTRSAPNQPFLDDLEKLHQQTGPWQVVLLTSDLVQKGTPDEFRDMLQEVLARLWENWTNEAMTLAKDVRRLELIGHNHHGLATNPAQAATRQ